MAQTALQGVFAKGYGYIPRAVTINKKLTWRAKLIYSYLASYAGKGMTAFPSVSLMLQELGMCKTTFYKGMNELKLLGYITVVQQRDKGTFARNLYRLEKEVSPCPTTWDTTKSDTIKQDSNKTSPNKNKFNKNRYNNHPEKFNQTKIKPATSLKKSNHTVHSQEYYKSLTEDHPDYKWSLLDWGFGT